MKGDTGGKPLTMLEWQMNLGEMFVLPVDKAGWAAGYQGGWVVGGGCK